MTLIQKLSMFCCLVFFFHAANAQHQEYKYNSSNTEDIPDWAVLMYSDEADPGEVSDMYEEYYLNNPFVKNQHTQYFKHWIRNILRDPDAVFWTNEAVDKEALATARQKYLESYLVQPKSSSTTWECLGPVDYDHDAAGRSYAPGAGHVYTVEQAPSNANTMWAGTATAGVWKSLDYGANWTLTTANYLINGVRTIEIDHNDDGTVYFGAAGDIYKTTDGGTTWSVVGDATFQAVDISANDMRMYPGSSSVVFLCAEQGLYRSADAGANWTQVMSGTWQEIEFKPGNPQIAYAVHYTNDHTELYKSTDGGLTWSIRGNGWPGIASVNSSTFNALTGGGATSDYTSFGSNVNLGDGTLEDFTVELRIKASSWSGDPAILSNKNWASGTNAGFVIAANGNGWKFNIADGTTRIDIDGNNINDNQWHHLSVTYDKDGDKKVYQDGLEVGSSSTQITGSTATALGLALLQDGTFNYGYGLNASVAEVRVWKKVLDAATIATNACAGVDNTHADYTDLVHHWKLDENTGTNIADSKGSNTGTVQGSSSWSSGNETVCKILDLEAGEHQRRTEIAVSAAAPNQIIALASGDANGGSGLYGVYKSTDAGETWTFNCCGPQPAGPASTTNQNMLGYSDTGNDNGGQFYYDLALGVSQTNADHISIAGIQRWETFDGGATWSCPAKWSHPYKATYIHADIHDLHYLDNGDIWVANDGGIYHSTDNGASFNKRMYGIAGTDFWGFGAGAQDGDVMVGGTYHNSTLLKDGDTYINGWISTAIGGAGGDNVRGFVNPGDERTLYMDAGKRVLPGDRTVGFSDYSFAKQTNASGTTGRSSDMLFHPNNPFVIYTAEGSQIWKTEDGGETATLVGDVGEHVTAMDWCFGNTDVMYAATFTGWWDAKHLFKSTDGGATWTQLTLPWSGTLWAPIDVTVDASDPNRVWVARTPQSGNYTALNGEKVYFSTDGGATWTNWTTSTLDGEHVTNIVYQRGTNDGVYIGTRRAVYYRNGSMGDWTLYTSGLPASTYSTKLIPFYAGNKLRNGTNRSVYEVDLFESSSTQAQISSDKQEIQCSREPVQFFSNSVALAGATYAWQFPGATPATSSDRNPIVEYNGEGTYNVTLTVTDANGSDTQTLNNFITVYPSECERENIPDMALSPNGSGYVNLGRPEDLNFTGNDPFTFAAWIKPGSDNQHGYILAKYDRFVVGQYYFALDDGKIKLAREVSPWSTSGTTNLTSGNWYHVAGTYDGSVLRVYVNGELENSLNMTGSISGINRDILIGSRYASGQIDSNFDGLIDELSIWKRALTIQELRELRHLTLDQVTDVDLVGYYQFNESGTTVFDRGLFNNGEMQSTAARSTSTAPVGGGISHTVDVSSAGTKTFTGTGLEMIFPASGALPGGDLVVSRINLQPDELPSANTPSSAYWTVNNYGSNATFAELESISFDNIGQINAAQDASEFKLYKRADNADGSTWGSSIDYADSKIDGTEGSVTFAADNGITSFSQFIIMDESAVLPVDWLYFKASLQDGKTVDLEWSTASEENSQEFVIERSADGREFTEIGRMPAAGNSETVNNYQTEDSNPLRGISYYRIQQIDLDGSVNYSDIQSITLNAIPTHIALYPNPIAAGDKLQIVSDLNEDLEVEVFNTKGRTLIKATVLGGVGEVRLNDLAPGAYFYKITGSEKMKRGKLIVR